MCVNKRPRRPTTAELLAIKPVVDRYCGIGGLVLIDNENLTVAIALTPERARLLTEDEWPRVLEDAATMRAFFRAAGLKVHA
jgi:hypothetical protein